MGDNFLRQQVENFKRGCDLAMQESASPTLFERPDVVRTLFTVTPLNGKPFEAGESLWAVAGNGSQKIAVMRGHESVGTIDGDAARVLLQADRDLSSFGVTKVQVVKIGELSGVAKVEITENRGPK